MQARVTVAVDCSGADMGPQEVAAGAAIAARDSGVRSVLFGPAQELRAGLAEVGAGGGLIEVVDAPVSIAKAPEPASAVRATPDASVVQAARAVAGGRAQAFVSGGSTGAALAAGTMVIKRGRGIYRPALALALPRPGAHQRPVTLLDAGANPEVRSESLVQFAFMGAAFASAVIGIDSPRVALLSNGAEPDRGTPVVREAHETLSGLSTGPEVMRFLGNLEGTDLFAGLADVFVCDGFTGNVALKVAEGVSQFLLGTVRDVAMSSPRSKAGGLLLRPGLSALKHQIDPEQFGGAYLLGLRSLGVVPHGRFSRVGFANAVRLAALGADHDLVGKVHAALGAAGALRQPRPLSTATAAGDSVSVANDT